MAMATVALMTASKEVRFLHRRGKLRGAQCVVVKKIDKKTVLVQLLNDGTEVAVPVKQVRREAPTPAARVIGGGLPTLGRKHR